MNLLLDTHALLWWLNDDPGLGRRARGLIEDPGNAVLFSAASLWEVAVKVRIGKLDASVTEIADAAERGGFRRIGIRTAHLAALGTLPFHADHRDPFDHLLIAQAIAEGATFVTEDRHAARYPVASIPCSDPPATPP